MSSSILITTLLLAWRPDLSYGVRFTHQPLLDHPPVENLKVELVNNRSAVIIRWEKPANITNNYIKFYRVQVRQALHDLLSEKRREVAPPLDHVKVDDLFPEYVYVVRVSLMYTDKKNVFSNEVNFTTQNANITAFCLCDRYGSKNSTFNNGTCENNSLNCHCLEHYAGSHCSICTAGHYRDSSLGVPTRCMVCPCSLGVSNGDCRFSKFLGRPACMCKPLKTGPMCEICKPGYYQDPDNEFDCLKCTCPPLEASQSNPCDPRSGMCNHCPNGTAGLRCERCAEGWSGAPPRCRPLAAARPRHSGLTLLAAVLAAVAVAVALGLGYWVMRLRARQKRLNAWSLELNRYELEHPGVVDTGSQSGLMMEEAAPGYGGANEVSTVAPGPLRKDDQLIFRAARLQLRSAEPPAPPAPPGGPLV